MLLNSPLIFHLTYEPYCWLIYVGQSYSSVGHQYTRVGQTVNLSFTYVGQNVRWLPIYIGQFHEWVGQCPWPTDILRPVNNNKKYFEDAMTMFTFSVVSSHRGRILLHVGGINSPMNTDVIHPTQVLASWQTGLIWTCPLETLAPVTRYRIRIGASRATSRPKKNMWVSAVSSYKNLGRVGRF
jgi:hypothetical protein